MPKGVLVLIFISISCYSALAQKAVVRGIVVDTTENRQLENARVRLIRPTDSLLLKTTYTDPHGLFEISGLDRGRYMLQISYPKMADRFINIRFADTSIFFNNIHMELKSKALNEVVIRGRKKAISLRADTLVFQADSFAVRSNANVEELLKRLPGVMVDKDGNISTQGQNIKTVLVDGDEFFGDDPLVATKYLKADAVEEVQLYDRKSKSAELSGIDDGVRNKTINIKLKENAKNGYLGAVDINKGNEDFRDYGAMAGIFKGKFKAAAFGTYSNLTNESKINNSMRRLKGEDYDIIEVGDDGSSVMYASGGDYDDDYSSPTGGLPDNLNLGGHISNRFHRNRMGVKVNIRGFDYKGKDLRTYRSQELLPNGALFISSGKNNNNTGSTGESIRGMYSFNVDSLSSLKIAFGARGNRTYSSSTSLDDTRSDKGFFISQNNQINTGNGDNEIFNGNINWSKRFKKRGRTLSVDIQPESLSGKSTENSLNNTRYYDDFGFLNRIENINLNKDNTDRQHSIGARVSYTEPLTTKWAMEASYSFKTISSSSFRTVTDNRVRKIDSLSNNFRFVNFSNVGRVMMQYRFSDFSISTGMEATRTKFELNDLDRSNDFDRSYLNLTPSTNLFYKINENNTISVNYNGYMQQPDINQLQPVRLLNNPLYQIVGNSALRPSFTNSLGISYNSFQFASDQYLSGSFTYGFTNNAIVGTEIVDDFNKRISSYTNLNGNNSLSGGIYYSKGFSRLNFRMGVDLGFSNSNNLSVINFTENKIRNTQYNLRTSFNYYTPKADVSYTPSAAFMTGKSSIGGLNDGKSLIHDHEFSGTVQLPYQLEFNTTVSLTFRPANSSFGRDLNIAIWNSYLSGRMLKNNALEIKLSVTDILNQKIGYDRFVGGNLISESTYSYVPGYVLLGLNWNLSGNFLNSSRK